MSMPSCSAPLSRPGQRARVHLLLHPCGTAPPAELTSAPPRRASPQNPTRLFRLERSAHPTASSARASRPSSVGSQVRRGTVHRAHGWLAGWLLCACSQGAALAIARMWSRPHPKPRRPPRPTCARQTCREHARADRHVQQQQAPAALQGGAAHRRAQHASHHHLPKGAPRGCAQPTADGRAPAPRARTQRSAMLSSNAPCKRHRSAPDRLTPRRPRAAPHRLAAQMDIELCPAGLSHGRIANCVVAAMASTERVALLRLTAICEAVQQAADAACSTLAQ